MSVTTVVVLEGAGVGQHVPSVADADTVIAVDGGLAAAHRWGLRPDRVVGDLDSVPTELLERAVADGVAVDRHPPDKDETDFELAGAVALGAGQGSIVVLGGDGGRLDHQLGNLAVIADLGRSCPTVEAWMGTTLVVPVTARTWERQLPTGAVVSLQAWGGRAVVSLDGVRWPLDREVVDPFATRCVSNEAAGGPVRLVVHEGDVLCIVPDAAGSTS